MDSSGKSFGLEYQRMNCIGCAPSLHIFCMVLEVRNEGAPYFALFCIFIGSMHKISACPVAAQPEQSGFFVSMDFRGLALLLQFVLLPSLYTFLYIFKYFYVHLHIFVCFCVFFYIFSYKIDS